MSDIEPHTPPTQHRTFHEQLGALKQRVLGMSQRAEELVALAVEAFLERDTGKAVAVVNADREVDAMEVELERMSVSLLALQQPMARDLRFIVSALKITGDLERVGDHAVNIAQCARRTTALPPGFAAPRDIGVMAQEARSMLSDALDAVVRIDGALGRAVCERDDRVDSLHDGVFRTVLPYMEQHPEHVRQALEVLLVSRNLERIADLATNIAEDAVYLAEGKVIKHNSEAREATGGG